MDTFQHTFRLILIFLGLAVLFVIYLLETQRRRKNKEDRERQQEPSLADADDSDAMPDDVPNMPNIDAFRSQPSALHPTSYQADGSPIGAGLLGREAVADPIHQPAVERSPVADPGAATSPPDAWVNPFDDPLSPPPASNSTATPATVQNDAPTNPAFGAIEPAPTGTEPPSTAAPAAPPPPEPAIDEADEVPEPPPGMAELVVALQLSAPPGARFSGRELQEALRHCNMQYGAMQIYHRYSPRHRSLFYMANAVEPGSFDLTSMANTSTPGVVFFLRLPTVLAGRDAFDLMLDTAQRIAERIGGELQDQQRNPLGRHELILLRERIAEYEYKVKRRRRELAAG